MRHIVIVPARNERQYISQTLQSLLAQTAAADRIYVVDDGSTDDTADAVECLASDHPIIKLIRLSDRGYRRMGGGVVEAFNAAYERCRNERFQYISKIDADQILPENYFQVLLDFLDAHPEFAAAGGVPYDLLGSRLRRWRMPATHVPGPLKTIRRTVFDEIGGFLPMLGWDVLDEVKMRRYGYRTGHLEELKVVHLRPHGTAEGAIRGKIEWGKGAYLIGSHPLFVAARAVYRMWEPPYLIGGLAVLWGYAQAALRGMPQLTDSDLVAALRQEQLQRLFHRNRLRGH